MESSKLCDGAANARVGPRVITKEPRAPDCSCSERDAEMEVAGQWRREWAGAAEYGKVTEGGVTRRVARAMEVLNASGPGARVRVMRAAYHSTSGPGVPASSYMLHSSRRVISSGFNILESPSFPTKPLEISSTPLESSPESNIETENYKVTEPDDMDISEPSKWRGTTGRSSIRMPSEESSSTDNASIIDLDSRFSRSGLYRKYSYDSENSDVHSFKRDSARTSPLLDAPVTLSTLKYKSLLNSSSDWNNRRKSYSFEDTSPLNEIILQSNDTLAMESSTDSGICKSSEIVNDYTEDTHKTDFMRRENQYNIRDSIENLHIKNKHSSYKSSKMKTYKEHDIVIEDPQENNIALQSTGKLTITVPMTIEGDEDDDDNKKSNEDGDRKVKKVEFCKTELHFAAESGRVNIIATDEKPPPTNDFRKRRSAFVPIRDKFEKPITLFGEKSDFPVTHTIDDFRLRDFGEPAEFDENTAATKSILKNKIPKPKPYLLGENMAFGNNQDTIQSLDSPVSVGVSLINKELEANRIYSNKQSINNYVTETTREKSFTNSLRTINKGPPKELSSKVERSNTINEKHTDSKSNTAAIKGKLQVLQMSPVPTPKTRQLRESELTYFGIKQNDCSTNKKINRTESKSALPWTDLSENTFNTFESVRLIKKYSNSAQNSDAESTDSHDYQNIPLKTNFAPVPIPRSRAKYIKPEEQGVILKPIIEQVYDSNKAVQETRRSRSRKQDDIQTSTSRSLSAPAKNHNNYVGDTIKRYETRVNNIRKENTKQRNEVHSGTKVSNDKNRNDTAEDIPLYANVEIRENEMNDYNTQRAKPVSLGIKSSKQVDEKKKSESELSSIDKKQITNKVNHRVKRTEKLSTPEKSNTIDKGASRTRNSLDKSISNSGSAKDQYKSRQKLNNKVDISSHNNENRQEIHKPRSAKKEDVLKKSNGHTIKDKNVKAIEIPRSNKDVEANSLNHRITSKQSKMEKDGADRVNNNTNGRRSSRRSEYVIKYDDKNGTVSSVCKVRSGHSTQRKKHQSKERNKEHIKDYNTKNTEKSALLSRTSDTKRKK
ncbi:uncharacterized protein LOC114356722 isoform X3 [Ostrinia furnacalis]|uniref:uncharacterized protein LOC114356722 isoform X3 n=1 Tax=Ostrinia furnacalis TaxID=93504 RepID=UPI001039A4C3|nr:uncharacterized protein LOC114356722 isoform X3 [Ostrinia furnacalis]